MTISTEEHLVGGGGLPCDPSVQVAQECRGNLWSPEKDEGERFKTDLKSFINCKDWGTKSRSSPEIRGIQPLHCFRLYPFLPTHTAHTLQGKSDR